MKNKQKIFRAIGMITQIGISMMVPVFLCTFIGYKLDERFHTSCWFLIGMLIGFITSFRNVYVLTKGFYAKDKEREDAQMNYFENLRQNKQEYTHKEKRRKKRNER